MHTYYSRAMPRSRSPLERRRPRRGSLDRPVNGRLYRAALLLALIPVIALALSVRRPLTLAPPQLPPTFDGAAAAALTRDLATLYPDRSPGSDGAQGARTWLIQQLGASGYATQTDTFAADIPGLGRRELANVWAVAPGRTSQAIVVAAHRDDSGAGPGADDNASGTAALVELARTYGGGSTGSSRVEQPAHTIVFLSTDGGSFGSLGAARFAADPRWRHSVVAVVNLDALAGRSGPRLEVSGDRARSPASALVQTASVRVQEQTGRAPRRTGAAGQLFDLALPFSLYDQAPFVGRGIPALTLTTSGIRPREAFDDTPEALDTEALSNLGRASQQLVESLDQGLEIARGTTTYVWLGGRILSGWAVQLLLVALLLPFLAAVVDLFARCRRLGVQLGPALRAYRSRLAFWLWVGVLFEVFGLAGAWPSGPARPVDPASAAATDWPVVPLAILATLSLASWQGGRARLRRRRPARDDEVIAGYTAVALAVGLASILTLAINPYSLLFLLPSAHAWLWLGQARDRPLVRLALLAAGLAGPAAILLSFAVRFQLGWDAPWYVLLLAAVGKLPLSGIAIGLAWCAALAQVLALETGRYAPYPAAQDRRLGPVRSTVRTLVLARRRRRSGMRLDQVGAPARRGRSFPRGNGRGRLQPRRRQGSR